jgi:hypothetical protein
MSIVPAHKSDDAACAALSAAGDDAVIARLEELLVWLQDLNWPVAHRVEARIKSLGPALIGPVRAVLNGADDVWKWSLVASLLPQVDGALVEALRPELARIAERPSFGEAENGVDEAVRDLWRGGLAGDA